MRRFRSGRSTEAWNVLAAWWNRQRETPIRIGMSRVMRQFVSICSDKSSPAEKLQKDLVDFCRKLHTPCIPRTDRSPRRRRACIGRTLYLHLARKRGLMGSILWLCNVENQVSRFFVISRPSTSDSWLYLSCIFFISVFWFCSVMYVFSRHRLNLCDVWVRLRLWFGFHQGRSIVGDEGRLPESFCGGSDFVLQQSTLQATCSSNLKCRRVIWATQGRRKFRCKFNLWTTWNYTESQRDVSENCGTCWRWFGVHADAHHTSEDCRACWRWFGFHADSHYASEDCRACWRWSGVHADAHHTSEDCRACWRWFGFHADSHYASEDCRACWRWSGINADSHYASEDCRACWRWSGVHADAYDASEDCRACWWWSGVHADSHYTSEDCRACWRWSGVHADAYDASEDCRACWRWSGINADSHYASEDCRACWRWSGVHADAYDASEDCRACWWWSGINADSHYTSEDCRACWRWHGYHADAQCPCQDCFCCASFSAVWQFGELLGLHMCAQWFASISEADCW